MGSSKKSTIASKQMLGAHWLWTLGPIDKLVKLMFGEDKRVAWQGEQAESGTIIVDAENLFGGKKKEGGVSGAVDVEFGDSAQGRNAYLQSQLGNDIPAYRGLLGLVFRGISSGGFYFGTNPHLKKVSILAQRIHVRQDGIAQWYDEKAEIPAYEQVPGFANFSSGYLVYYVITSSLSFPDPENTSDPGWQDNFGNASSFGIFGFEYDAAGGNFSLPAASSTFAFYEGWDTALYGGIQHDDFATQYLSIELMVAGSVVAAIEISRLSDSQLQIKYGPNLSALSQADYTVGTGPRAGVLVTGGLTIRNGAIAYVNAGVSGINGYVHDWSTTYAGEITSARVVCGPASITGMPPGGENTNVRWEITGLTIPASGDINPAHFIREALTDPDWGRGLPEADMGDSFTTAADVFHAEGMGISLRWDRQMSIEEFVEVLLSHADAALYEDRTTGKFELKPIRADYDPDLLDVLDKTVISKIDKPNWRVFGDLPTAVTVVYTDPDNGDDASVTHSNPALAAMQGKEKETTLQYPGFRRADLAARVAARDSRALGSEIFTCDLIGSRALLDYNAGDVDKLNWPEYGISNMIFRVTQGPKVEGRNKIRLSISTDVYALPDLAPVATPVDEWVDPSQPPEATTLHIATEAPYYELVQRNGEAATDAIIAENQDLGYILATAVRPAYAINASIYVDAGAGYEDSGVVDFCPYAELGAAVGPTDTVWAITGGIDLDQVRIGSHAEINGELFRVDAISVGEDQLTVGRGVLDTVPAPTHAAGSSIFFWDDYAEGDGTEYVTAESIDVKVVPQSGAGASDLADIAADTVVMATRAFRPYPPGNLLIDTFAYPGSVGAASFSATVAHRDRTQQTSGTLQDTTYGNIGPEAGVTYTWTLYRTDTEAVLQSYSGDSVTSKAFAPGHSGEVRLEVKAVRDSEDSWQSLTHTFQLGSIFNRITETGDARITETGDIRTTE